jgi:hypothetical protein
MSQKILLVGGDPVTLKRMGMSLPCRDHPAVSHGRECA